MNKSSNRQQSIEQRWARPLFVEPGHWKKQLPAKYLQIAASGDIGALQSLLAAHPEFLNKRGSHNRTLLWEATRRGRLKAVEFLFEQGANADALGCYNSESHVQLSPFCAAVYYKKTAIADFLRSRVSSPDIFRTAFLGDEERLTSLLSVEPELIYAEDPFDDIYFMPLISFAVAGGHFHLTKTLIARGARVAAYSDQLIFLAARCHRHDIIDLLLSGGVDIRVVGPSVFAASDIETIDYLLQNGVPLQCREKTFVPPLVFVARGDKGARPDKIELLLSHGADVNAAAPGGKTALHYAAAAGNKEVAAQLLQHQANPKLTDERGQTPLNLAVAAKKWAVVDLLKSL